MQHHNSAAYPTPRGLLMRVGSGGPQCLWEVGGGGLSKPGSLELPGLGRSKEL